MQIETTRWGTVEVADNEVIHFPQGLYGLEHLREFCLLPGDGPFVWLQAVRDPKAAIILTNPFLYFPDYEVVVPDAAADTLDAKDPVDVSVYTTVSLEAGGQTAYTNLLGPLIINYRARRGAQQVQDDRRYSARHRLGEEARQDKVA